ncbi:nuclear transport factor 2 family protein [Sphingobium estronivorans]|uniref:nuclear transport factor 2 family protein n=1 Tax=Sphingobium estronivorans TaxID=1577690 RepID=UPI001F07217A|nr:nuclear transport factor 2 family protein [Sphingobium estronivorans]
MIREQEDMISPQDVLALRRTAELYARGADRRCAEDWLATMDQDIEITGPGFSFKGREAALGSLVTLGQMFKSTRHIVHNQLVEIDGDHASGETYATAEHRMAGEGGDVLLCWAIRYQDEWRREAGQWRFTRRDLILDWEELRPLKTENAI